jgi:hypothetical protein
MAFFTVDEANTKEKDLVAAKAEMARLSGDLAALKAREGRTFPNIFKKSSVFGTK